jgi:hypothetical protein
VGTAEVPARTADERFSRPPGRVLPGFADPALKTPGYFRQSLRDNSFEEMGTQIFPQKLHALQGAEAFRQPDFPLRAES